MPMGLYKRPSTGLRLLRNLEIPLLHFCCLGLPHNSARGPKPKVGTAFKIKFGERNGWIGLNRIEWPHEVFSTPCHNALRRWLATWQGSPWPTATGGPEATETNELSRLKGSCAIIWDLTRWQTQQHLMILNIVWRIRVCDNTRLSNRSNLAYLSILPLSNRSAKNVVQFLTITELSNSKRDLPDPQGPKSIKGDWERCKTSSSPCLLWMIPRFDF